MDPLYLGRGKILLMRIFEHTQGENLAVTVEQMSTENNIMMYHIISK